MTKDQIVNICKRIEENKATEEEICALRDMALRTCDAPEVAKDTALLDWAETHPVAAMEELIGWWETAGPGCRETRFEFRNILKAAMQAGRKP